MKQFGLSITGSAPRIKSGAYARVARCYSRHTVLAGLSALLLLAATSGCSIRYAINQLGNALAQSGQTFASDDDPELIKAAAPFSLKLIESLLAETPHHEGLLLAAASGFTQYSYAFVQEEADETADRDYTKATAMRDRAKRLYRRARDYGVRGLEVRHPGISASLHQSPKDAVRGFTAPDVPLMYWTAAAWASLISLSKDNPEVIADQPVVEALIDRAVELDEDYDDGSLHSFLISYELARQGAPGDPVARARKEFDQAVALSKGQQAAPYVALAEGVSVKNQNVAEFKRLLNQALAVKVDAKPKWRLVNLVMQRRARWLLGRIEELFLIVDESPDKAK